MSFRLSSGTLDVLAGVYAPPKKRRPGSGGGKGGGAKTGGSFAAQVIQKLGTRSTDFRAGLQAKHAFGGGSNVAVSRRAASTMERTARRVPEVMVRITGRQHGGGHVLANFSYISRLGHGSDKELALHTSDGDVLHDGRDMQVLAQDWHEWEMGDGARRAGATSISMILSMPTGTDPECLQEAALAFAREEFANRSWVASLHVDRDHPHVHLTFARRDHDGRRFHPDRDDLFRYRQRFAQKLRDRGIEANATPARVRGIDPTHEPIAARKVREKGEVPRIDRSRADRAQRLREQGLPDPVQAVLADRQAAVRTAYERSIAELSSSPSFADQVIAKSIERFVQSMPAPEPNSALAARETAAERSTADASKTPPVRDIDDIPADNPVAAALARMRAMREKALAANAVLQAADRSRGGRTPADLAVDEQLRKLLEKVNDPDQKRQEQERQNALAERLRLLSEKANELSAPVDTSLADKIIRQTQEHERERAQRERDRSRDREGPRR